MECYTRLYIGVCDICLCIQVGKMNLIFMACLLLTVHEAFQPSNIKTCQVFTLAWVNCSIIIMHVQSVHIYDVT